MHTALLTAAPGGHLCGSAEGRCGDAPARAGTDVEHAQHIHNAMKLPVIGGFTQAEGVALGAFVTSGDKGAATPNLDLGIHGLILGDGAPPPPAALPHNACQSLAVLQSCWSPGLASHGLSRHSRELHGHRPLRLDTLFASGWLPSTPMMKSSAYLTYSNLTYLC